MCWHCRGEPWIRLEIKKELIGCELQEDNPSNYSGWPFILFVLFSFAVCLMWIKMKIMLRSFLLSHIKSRNCQNISYCLLQHELNVEFEMTWEKITFILHSMNIIRKNTFIFLYIICRVPIEGKSHVKSISDTCSVR